MSSFSSQQWEDGTQPKRRRSISSGGRAQRKKTSLAPGAEAPGSRRKRKKGWKPGRLAVAGARLKNSLSGMKESVKTFIPGALRKGAKAFHAVESKLSDSFGGQYRFEDASNSDADFLGPRLAFLM